MKYHHIITETNTEVLRRKLNEFQEMVETFDRHRIVSMKFATRGDELIVILIVNTKPKRQEETDELYKK